MGGTLKWWAIGGGLLAVALLGGLCLAVHVMTWVPEENRRLPAPRYLEHPPQYIGPSPAEDGAKP